MNEALEKKNMEKERRRRQEIEDDRKIHAALDQMREDFRKEENPKDDVSQLRSSSAISNRNNKRLHSPNQRPESNLNL